MQMILYDTQKRFQMLKLHIHQLIQLYHQVAIEQSPLQAKMLILWHKTFPLGLLVISDLKGQTQLFLMFGMTQVH